MNEIILLLIIISLLFILISKTSNEKEIGEPQTTLEKQTYKFSPDYDEDNEIITLMKYLSRYKKSERFLNILEIEKDENLREFLKAYKQTFLDAELEKERLDTPDVCIENPYIGDLEVCLGHVRSNRTKDQVYAKWYTKEYKDIRII